jgi:GxxExxY protein
MNNNTTKSCHGLHGLKNFFDQGEMNRLDAMGGRMIYEELSGKIIGAAMEVHAALGAGFLEVIYERALPNELSLRKINFERQAPISINYKQTPTGQHRADFIVDVKIILEIKAVSALIPEHYAQIVHYLTATGLRLALLLNFKAPSLQYKRIIR